MLKKFGVALRSRLAGHAVGHLLPETGRGGVHMHRQGRLLVSQNTYRWQ